MASDLAQVDSETRARGRCTPAPRDSQESPYHGGGLKDRTRLKYPNMHMPTIWAVTYMSKQQRGDRGEGARQIGEQMERQTGRQ